MSQASANNYDTYPLVRHVQNAIDDANSNFSDLPDEILELGGMSSPKVRHFLNNVCDRPGTRYLEVGTYAGSTLVSALYGNESTVLMADAIDDYSQFGGWETFQAVTEKYLKPGQFTFHKKDFREVTPESFAERRDSIPVSVYFYDGGHTLHDHEDAVNHFWPCLADEFILIVDDWNEPQVRAGTKIGLGRQSHEIIQQRELPSRGNGDVEQWWNGLFVAVIRKLK